MFSTTSRANSAAEFQIRLTKFRRVARVWSSLIILVAAIGTIIQLSIGSITDKDPWNLQLFGVALLMASAVAALRIFFSYQHLFVCPVCGHKPHENDLGVILVGVWSASSLNPTSCAVCGTVLR